MIDVNGNLWDYPADAVAITTNGFIKKNGHAVMGRGCAREAAERWPGLPLAVATAIRVTDNHLFTFKNWDNGQDLVIFPVKHNWWERANMDLIVRSCREAMAAADQNDWKTVVLPRPGCGNGGLPYGGTGGVRNAIATYLDERFHVITFA